MLTLAASSAFWWLAIPRHEICALTYPAPAGCGSARIPTATLWTAVTAASYGVTLLLAARQHQRRWWIAGLPALAAEAACGFVSVLYA
jgi:hypothetical protein